VRNLQFAARLIAVTFACGCSHAENPGHTPTHDLAPPAPDDLSVPGDGPPGSTSLSGPLTIMPLDPVAAVVVGMPAPTVQFTAYVGGVQTGAAWTIDRAELGKIDANGVFTPAGNLAGVGHVSAIYGTQTVSTTITVTLSRVDRGDPGYVNPPAAPGLGGYGGVGGDGPGAPPSPSQLGTLAGTATADATVTLLYPYDATVWPRGLLAPLIQWNPGAHSFDSVYVHMSEKNFDYKGYFAANKTPFVNVPIPQAAWEQLTFSNGGDPVTISLVFAQGANAYGPYSETWTIAPATMKGTIYYNSYGTQLVTNSDGNDAYGKQYGAGTLAISPGATAPTLIAGVSSPPPPAGKNGANGSGCRVCHTVSADGKTLVTQASNIDANDYSVSAYVDLTAAKINSAGTALATASLGFPAISKDGKLLFASTNLPGTGAATGLYSMTMGMSLAATGLGTNLQAGLPVFSPDTAHLSFNFWSGTLTPAGGGTLTGDKMSLAILDFDGTSAFSNPRVLYTPPAGTSVTYSSFLPTSAGIVFEVELKQDANNEWGFTRQGTTAELWWIDVASRMARRLDRLNGYLPGGATVYLPNNGASGTHPPGLDTTLNYEPTVNPIGSGGYAWVVFTSRRMYGNVATLDPWTSDPRSYKWLDAGQVTDKKLWVAAIDLNAPPGTDPSHPAFYLPAQELHAGNARGYWTVEKCAPDGSACSTGDECCGGYCQPSDGGLVCSSTMPMCAAEFEKCNITADCCGAGSGTTCINNICTQSNPIQ
jgi:hypothetical protein